MKKWNIPLTLLLLMPASLVVGQPPTGEYAPRKVIPRPIRPIVDPVVVSAAESNVPDNDLVIGVEINGQARAYPINQLTGPMREIINDKLGGTAIAATW